MISNVLLFSFFYLSCLEVWFSRFAAVSLFLLSVLLFKVSLGLTWYIENIISNKKNTIQVTRANEIKLK